MLIRSHFNYLQDDWVHWLPLAEFAAHNAVLESPRMTSFFANKHFHLMFNLDLSQPTSNQEAQDLAQHMNDVIEQLKANLLIIQEAQQSAANLYRVPAPFYQMKDQVWLNSKNIWTQKLSRKLDSK